MNYTDENRGVIQNRDRARQINSFKGLRYGKITPTDIDGYIEYKDTAAIFLEVKHGSASVPTGQKLAIQRAVDNFANSGKVAIFIVCEHDVADVSEDVEVASAVVREQYLGSGVWAPGHGETVKQAADAFLECADRSDYEMYYFAAQGVRGYEA